MTKKLYPALMLIHNNNPEKVEKKTDEETENKAKENCFLKLITNEEEV